MKTFSIAIGSYFLKAANPTTGQAQTVAPVGGSQPRTLADIELEQETMLRMKTEIDQLMAGGATYDEAVQARRERLQTPPPVGGDGEGEAPAEAEVAPLIIEGDRMTFAVDPEDYGVCVLTVTHADGSTSWARFRRNSTLLDSGTTPAPAVEETAPASPPTDSIDTPAPDEEYGFTGSSSKRGKKKHDEVY